MKIKNRLYMSAGISIILVVILLSLILVTSGRIAEGNKKHELVDYVCGGILELDLVTYDYLLHREKRMEQQWHLKYDSLGEILEKEPKEEVLISIHPDYAALGDLFSQVTANSAKIQRLLQERASQERIDTAIGLEERLATQLLITSHSIFTGASTLSKKAHAEVMTDQRLAANLTLILMIILAITLTTSLLLVVRSISRPLDELTESAEIFGKGDLEHRVGINSKDELGELAVAFNHMTARRQLAERALSQSEAKYQDLYNSAPIAYFSLGTDGMISVANKAAEGLTGYRSEELQRMKVFDLYAEESKEKAKGLLERFKRGISCENEEMIYERKDGQKVYGLLSVSPIKDANGQVLESRSVVVDITERKRTEEELEKHKGHLEGLVRERTDELQKTVNLMAGREVRMAELKKVIEKLRAQLKEAGLTPVADDPLKEMAKETAAGME